MSFLDKMENMQKKPDHIKRRIVFAGVFLIMFIIIAVWVSTLKITLSDKSGFVSASSPFVVFKNIFGEAVEKTSDGIADIISGAENTQDYGAEQ